MRKSIFDIVTENTNIASDVKRILSMAQNEKILCVNGYTYYKLFDFIDTYCFKYWLHRNHCIDVDDYLKTIKFSQIKSDAASNPQSLLTLIELIYNFWHLLIMNCPMMKRIIDCNGVEISIICVE